MAFEPRVVSFIKIVGTRNTANEVSFLSNQRKYFKNVLYDSYQDYVFGLAS